MEFDFKDTPDGMLTPQEQLPPAVIDAVFSVCERIADGLQGGTIDVPLEDLMAEDLVAFLKAGPFEQQAATLSPMVGSPKALGYELIPRALRRVETGELVVFEVKSPSGISLRGREMWWFTRKARTGTCPRCSAPFDPNPLLTACSFCGEGLLEQPWILVRVVDGVSGTGEGIANPSVRFAWLSESVRRQIKGRINRAANAYLSAVMTGDLEPLSRFADATGFEELQQLMAATPDARAIIERHGGPSEVALKVDWSALEDCIESTMQLKVAVPSTVDVALAPFVSQRWRWERKVPSACPQCGGKLPKADAPEMCPYCGNIEGIGEWRIAHANTYMVVPAPAISKATQFGPFVTTTVKTEVVPLSVLGPDVEAALREAFPGLDLKLIPSPEVAQKLGALALEEKARLDAEAASGDADTPESEGAETPPLF